MCAVWSSKVEIFALSGSQYLRQLLSEASMTKLKVDPDHLLADPARQTILRRLRVVHRTRTVPEADQVQEQYDLCEQLVTSLSLERVTFRRRDYILKGRAFLPATRSFHWTGWNPGEISKLVRWDSFGPENLLVAPHAWIPHGKKREAHVILVCVSQDTLVLFDQVFTRNPPKLPPLMKKLAYALGLDKVEAYRLKENLPWKSLEGCLPRSLTLMLHLVYKLQVQQFSDFLTECEHQHTFRIYPVTSLSPAS